MRFEYGLPFFTICLHIYCQYKVFILSSLFHFLNVFVAIAVQSFDNMSAPSIGIIFRKMCVRTFKWTKVNEGVVAQLDPTPYLNSYKVPHQ